MNTKLDKVTEAIAMVLIAFMIIFILVVGNLLSDREKEVSPVESEIYTETIAEATQITQDTEIEPIPINYIPEAESIAETLNFASETEPPKAYTEEEAVMCAKVLYGECKDCEDRQNQACVVWTILNRVDSGEGTIAEVITRPSQFYYKEHFPIKEELLKLAKDVLDRWEREHNGEIDVGRVLPSEFKWYASARKGDGTHRFRNAHDYPFDYWDFSLPNPYEV